MLAAAAVDDRSRWSAQPEWYLWDGGFAALGVGSGIVPPHQHHAIQIVIADGSVGIAGEDGEWCWGSGVIVRPDITHSYHGNSVLGMMIFVDPESMEGRWLCSSLKSDITVVRTSRMRGCVEALRAYAEPPFERMAIDALIQHCARALCTGAPPARHLDSRITLVLEAIRASDDLRIPIQCAAASVFLSPSRFAHLFKQQVGLPYRRYLLWRKVTRAMRAIGREASISAAAHQAGFADAAHLSRTFQQMLGLPPSVLMRGRFFEIPSPFSLGSQQVDPRRLTAGPLWSSSY